MVMQKRFDSVAGFIVLYTLAEIEYNTNQYGLYLNDHAKQYALKRFGKQRLAYGIGFRYDLLANGNTLLVVQDTYRIKDLSILNYGKHLIRKIKTTVFFNRAFGGVRTPRIVYDGLAFVDATL
jgi:hypothetical protein